MFKRLIAITKLCLRKKNLIFKSKLIRKIYEHILLISNKFENINKIKKLMKM